MITIAIVITSLLFLPLNEHHYTSILFPFSAEPVFAQLSEEANITINNETNTTTTAEQAPGFKDSDGITIDNDLQDNIIVATGSSLDFAEEFIDYGEEQVSSIPSSSSSATSITDFDLFLDSFANSIFNGTSTFGGVGTSIVNGIEVSGISLDKSQNRLSVILGNTAIQVQTYNNIITGGDTETTTSTPQAIADSNSVSIIAIIITINMADILSLAAASSSNDNISDSAIEDTSENQNEAFFSSSNGFNPFSLLSGLQIGSSILSDVDWSEPQMVTMDLVSSTVGTNQEEQLNSGYVPMADLVLVSVIPYTGLANNSTSTVSSTTR